MTGDQLVDEFVQLCNILFSGNLNKEQRTVRFEKEMKRLVTKYCSGGEERNMIHSDSTCKT
jgi:hypothetical protein